MALGDYELTALKKIQQFKAMKKGCCQMSAKIPKKMSKKFEEADSFVVNSIRGTKLVDLTSVEECGQSITGKNEQWYTNVQRKENYPIFRGGSEQSA